jgi:dihydroxyacetone kinase-like protein
VIAIAGGMEKVRAVLGALRGGYINTLITDTETARAVLAEFEERR